MTLKNADALYWIVEVNRTYPSEKNKLCSGMFMSEFQDFVLDKILEPGKIIIFGYFN